MVSFLAARARLGASLIAILFLSTIPGLGCVGPGNRQTMRFDLARDPPGETITEKRSYFLWGLVPTADIDVMEKCAHGVVSIREEPGESGAAAWIPTLGLWSRRSTTYVCRATPQEPVS